MHEDLLSVGLVQATMWSCPSEEAVRTGVVFFERLGFRRIAIPSGHGCDGDVVLRASTSGSGPGFGASLSAGLLTDVGNEDEEFVVLSRSIFASPVVVFVSNNVAGSMDRLDAHGVRYSLIRAKDRGRCVAEASRRGQGVVRGKAVHIVVQEELAKLYKKRGSPRDDPAWVNERNEFQAVVWKKLREEATAGLLGITTTSPAGVRICILKSSTAPTAPLLAKLAVLPLLTPSDAPPNSSTCKRIINAIGGEFVGGEGEVEVEGGVDEGESVRRRRALGMSAGVHVLVGGGEAGFVQEVRWWRKLGLKGVSTPKENKPFDWALCSDGVMIIAISSLKKESERHPPSLLYILDAKKDSAMAKSVLESAAGKEDNPLKPLKTGSSEAIAHRAEAAHLPHLSVIVAESSFSLLGTSPTSAILLLLLLFLASFAIYLNRDQFGATNPQPE